MQLSIRTPELYATDRRLSYVRAAGETDTPTFNQFFIELRKRKCAAAADGTGARLLL